MKLYIDTCQRDVWPIMAWAASIVLVSVVVFLITGVWTEDKRFVGTGVILALVDIGLWLTVAFFYQNQVLYSVKPRGWRKMRRMAEREAYKKKEGLS